ncbi:MAG: hypothetical protein ACI9OJ_001978 [Myxococcota bacterium]
MGFAAAPAGHYGDAPEDLPTAYEDSAAAAIGMFPSAFESAYCVDADDTGAYVLATDGLRLGGEASIEAGTRDEDDPDGTFNEVDDDGGDDGLDIEFFGTKPKLVVTVTNVADEERKGYVNVLIDFDRSGAWDQSNEWVLKNMPVTVLPGGARTLSVSMSHLPQAWVRVVLSDTPVTSSQPQTGWDGCGTFASGEVEDYLLAAERAIAFDLATASTASFASKWASRWSSASRRRAKSAFARANNMLQQEVEFAYSVLGCMAELAPEATEQCQMGGFFPDGNPGQ